MLIESLLSGAVPSVAVVVGLAGARWYNKGREVKRAGAGGLVGRVDGLEKSVTTITIGLFGEETPFGPRGGFVPKVLDTLKEHGEGIERAAAAAEKAEREALAGRQAAEREVAEQVKERQRIQERDKSIDETP